MIRRRVNREKRLTLLFVCISENMNTRLLTLFLWVEVALAASRHEKYGLEYEVGQLYYADSEWLLRYNIEFTDYHETTKTLEHCVEKLTKICSIRKDKLCKFFIDKTKRFEANVRIDTEQLKIYKRNKRFIFFIIPVILGVTSMALLSSLAANRHALQTVKSELDANLNMLEHSIKTTKNMMDINEKIFEDMETHIANISFTIKTLHKTVDEYQFFNNILHVITFMMIEHNEDQSRLMNLYNGKAAEYIFNVVDYGAFLKHVDYINKTNLKSFQEIPPMTLDMLSFIDYSINKGETNTSIFIRLPIVNKKSFTIYEYIPIPFENGENLCIINIDATYYYRDSNKIFLLKKQMDRYCKTVNRFTICNPLMINTLQNPSHCLVSLIQKNVSGIDEFCIYKPIERKNHAISVSKTAFYYHVTEPTKIKLKCITSDEVILVEKSKLLKFDKDCNPYKMTKNTENAKEQSEFHTDVSQHYPEISEYDIPSQEWTPNVKVLSKFKLQLLEAKTQFTEIQSDIKIHKEIISKIEFKDYFDVILEFFSLENIFPVKYFKISFYVLCTLAVAYIFKSCILPLSTCKSS